MFLKVNQERWDNVRLVIPAYIDDSGYVIPSSVSTTIHMKNMISVNGVLQQLHFPRESDDSKTITLSINGRDMIFERSLAEEMFGLLDRAFWKYLIATCPEMSELQSLEDQKTTNKS